MKLAIVNQSCNSGNILNLTSKKTCIISGSGRNSEAYSDGAEYFAFEIQEALKNGKTRVSLEDIFLTARKKHQHFAGEKCKTLALLKEK